MILNLYLPLCLLFILLQGFFAASEIAFISSNPIKLKHRQEKGEAAAAGVYARILRPEKFLTTALIGINLSLVISSSIFTLGLIHAGIRHSNLWTLVFFPLFVVIFGELLPKNVGRRFPEDFSCATYSVYAFFEKILEPAIKITEMFTGFFIRSAIGKVRRRSMFVTKEEVSALIKETEALGGIDKGEKNAIEQAMEFKAKSLSGICLALDKVIMLSAEDGQATVLDTVKKNRYTRFPVKRASEVVGYINSFDLFYAPDRDWQLCIRPITRVNAEDKLYDSFNLLRGKKENIALVVAKDKPCGIVTIQDIIREIVTSIVKI